MWHGERVSQPIEDYAVIGDRGSAALIGRDGSVDWLCLPRFDSAACFAALLGTPENGRWLLAPLGKHTTTRRYVGHTMLLETTHETPTGVVRVLDVMPTGDGRADVVRRVVGVSGHVRMRHEWIVRFDYGRVRPWIQRHQDDSGDLIVAIAGPDRLVLRGPRLPEPEDHRHVDELDVSEGDVLTFSITWNWSWRDVLPAVDLDASIARTLAEEEEWISRADIRTPHRELVLRSLLTLRLMTHAQTGGIVAAPTTSLPEDFGGERNWDYRFCWLRDAALTLESLLAAGYVDEARLWRGWLLRAVAGDPADLQIMYAVDGGRQLPETTLDHLPGYADSRPVRVGNGAVGQVQRDALGEVMVALHQARQAGIEEGDGSWELQAMLVDQLAADWDQPDHGLWEIRGPRQRFTHSRVMVWAALDRAVRAVEEHGLPGDVARWRSLREEVRCTVLEHGVDWERRCFVQHDRTTSVDASLLMVPLVGFLPGDHELVLGTIRAVEEDLLVDGLPLRSRTETGVDGLSGEEHPFLACCFWLVSAYAVSGQRDKAMALFDRLAGLANDVGLLSEEYDPVHDRMAGNFPQAFSHLTLVQAAMLLVDGD